MVLRDLVVRLGRLAFKAQQVQGVALQAPQDLQVSQVRPAPRVALLDLLVPLVLTALRELVGLLASQAQLDQPVRRELQARQVRLGLRDLLGPRELQAQSALRGLLVRPELRERLVQVVQLGLRVSGPLGQSELAQPVRQVRPGQLDPQVPQALLAPMARPGPLEQSAQVVRLGQAVQDLQVQVAHSDPQVRLARLVPRAISRISYSPVAMPGSRRAVRSIVELRSMQRYRRRLRRAIFL